MTRATLLTLTLALALVTMATAMLTVGQEPLSIANILSGDQIDRTILIHFRLPRVLLAILTGASLGMAGTVLQTMLRNPLASPDTIGFSAGASAGAAAVIVFSGSVTLAGWGAMGGGTLAAFAVLGFSWRGGIAPLSLILIGVAVSLMLAALTDILLNLSPGLQAAEVTRFLTGSFASAEWSKVALIGAATLFGGALLAWCVFAIERMTLGDDMARALGLNPNLLRLAVIAVSAVMVSTSVAVAGAILFVSFLAGPLARGLSGQTGCILPLAGLMGALLALSAELLAGIDIFGSSLPAGIFTALIGGPSMLALLLWNLRTADDSLA
ncbi:MULTISPECIES: FecCD family ABC transporter permease [Roseobacteraceae]|uniref:Putative siderophore transport system permease protein YfhA n=1 Tax=Pseudosulfitobacter pseudonitzschiae TaxID=1402135 RepID=A0A221K6L0_9RHOB|nr:MULTISPECIES: iron ABC transporter permease [Roseobacteraceae]ASM74487.1 putative siderophore transport system permease protein YfhA [Pseudosulfitobacter pseudonitzschiae]